MSKAKDETGNRYSRLLVIERAENTKLGQARWLCKCDCGNEVIVAGSKLRSGNTNSCSCYRYDRTREVATKHGHNRRGHVSRAYHSWAGMKTRCTNKKSPMYSRYGGRGISVEDEWLDFEKFLADMGEPPDGMSLDRINNDLGYSAKNCRWADHQTQMNNTSKNVFIEWDGRLQTVAQWARELGMNYQALYNRLFTYKWSVQRAMTEAVAN